MINNPLTGIFFRKHLHHVSCTWARWFGSLSFSLSLAFSLTLAFPHPIIWASVFGILNSYEYTLVMLFFFKFTCTWTSLSSTFTLHTNSSVSNTEKCDLIHGQAYPRHFLLWSKLTRFRLGWLALLWLLLKLYKVQILWLFFVSSNIEEEIMYNMTCVGRGWRIKYFFLKCIKVKYKLRNGMVRWFNNMLQAKSPTLGILSCLEVS